MNIRKGLTALVVVGALMTGVGSTTAFADTTPSNPPAAIQAKHSHCGKAADHVTRWRAKLTTLDARIAKLRQDRVKAVAAHKDDLVKRIDARIDKVQKHHVEIEGRIDQTLKACNLQN